MDRSVCPFCDLAGELVVRSNGAGWALRDSFPVAKGHTLVVPRHHVGSFFDLDPADRADLWQLVAEVRAALLESHRPDGFNIGINDGVAAGQTVGHAHIHVIPRYAGDVAEPRGGIRWVIPDRAPYWDADS